jgi:thiol-disulfide isomerase/thioredoxin
LLSIGRIFDEASGHPARRCGPCKNIAPIYDQLSSKYPNAHFLKVDVEECPETAVAYNVHSMPTFIFLRNKIR